MFFGTFLRIGLPSIDRYPRGVYSEDENRKGGRKMNGEDVRNRYERAVELQKAGSVQKIREAKAIFEELGTYEDCAKRIADCDRILAFSTGRHVELGSYGGKPVSWLVLDEKGRNRLLLADRCVEHMPFHKERDYTPWSHCSLRQWLNKDFLEQTFTLQERMALVLTECDNHSDPRWSIENGQDTKDKCFIFNYQDVERYLPEEKDRANGDWWWLRGHGFGKLCMQAIYADGTLYHIGVNKNSPEVGVRPAVWYRL